MPVFESGEASGELFIAMQLIDGMDLKGLIRQEGRLDPKRVLSIFRQAASALDAAHESGMVHRDVKPQNILVIPRENQEDFDRVYLTDFGLVRPVASETTASRTGTVFGSVPYMAPELIEGLPADGRADVYALGCVLFECLTGSVPFERDNEVSAVWAHIHEDPPLITDKCPELPGGLNDVVIKAMQKHPDDRFLTCGEFITELELGMGRKMSNLKYAYVRPLVARIPRRKTEREVWAPNFFPELSRVRSATRERLNWRKIGAFAAAVVLLSSVQLGREGGLPRAVADVADVAGEIVAAAVDPEPEPADRPRADTDLDPQSQGVARGGITSSDGKRLQALLPAGGRSTSTGTNDPASTVDGASPGSGKIAWARDALITTVTTSRTHELDMWVMDPDGSNQVRLTATAANEYGPTWSPDGKHIAYIRFIEQGPQEIWVMDANGDNQRDLGLCPGDEHCGRLAWSPSGRRVAYAQGTSLYVADLASGTRRLLAGGVSAVDYPDKASLPGPTWAPNGRTIAYNCGNSQESAQHRSLCLVAARGGEQMSQLRPTGILGFVEPESSPSGNWIAFSEQPPGGSPQATDVSIYVIRPDGTDRRQLTTDTNLSGAWSPTWSPDGGSVVYADYSTTRTGGLVRIDLDGSGRVQLTSGSIDYTPHWWAPAP